MKTQILSKQNAPVSIVGFLILMTTMTIGCAILSNAYPIMSLHPVLLTQDDLSTMQLTKSERISSYAFKQSWGEGVIVRYSLFNSTSAAQSAIRPLPGYRPEPNPEEVIGDGTWRVRKPPGIYFVKHNVLVFIIVEGHPSHRLQVARDIARKIEAKIAAVLP